jgi:hypothetical protein
MKYLFLLLVSLPPFLCIGQPAPVQVRIKNNSKLPITKMELTNSFGETFEFKNIKAHKISPYKKLSSLCSCSYQMKIWYSDKDAANSSCTNIRACDDFFKGKLQIKLDTRFNRNEANVELAFKKE